MGGSNFFFSRESSFRLWIYNEVELSLVNWREKGGAFRAEPASGLISKAYLADPP